MLKVGFALYRNWGWEIFQEIQKFQKEKPFFELTTLIVVPEKQFNFRKLKAIKQFEISGKDTEALVEVIKKQKLDIIFFYSWSWILKPEVFNSTLALALHPSPLPKYRGGTPIQHQLLAGEKKSAVTIFKISDGIDAGAILKQEKISFQGDINSIFERMVKTGTKLTKQILKEAAKDKLKFVEQKNLETNLPLLRRKKEESEIFLDKDYTFQYLNNLVRGLLDPYPNAFIRLNNKIIKLQKVSFQEKPGRAKILSPEMSVNKKEILVIKLKKGFARLEKFEIEKLD